MRLSAWLALLLTFSIACFAQRGGPAGAVPGSRATQGFGNVVFPGTGSAPQGGFSITDPSFAARLGSTVSGYYRPGYPPVPGRPNRPPGRGVQTVVVPYAYPVVVPGYGYSGYAEEQTPNITIINPPQQVPQVIVNQGYTPETASPVIREYPSGDPNAVRVYTAPTRYGSEPTPSGGQETGKNYLVAFKDHSIYSAMAYWVEGDTLHYVTPQGVHNQASLDMIDRDFTEELNRDRNLRFSVPKK